MAGCYEHGVETSVSGATELVDTGQFYQKLWIYSNTGQNLMKVMGTLYEYLHEFLRV